MADPRLIGQTGFGKSLSIDVTSHALSLSAAETASATIVFTGVLSGAKAFVLDAATPRVQKIVNATTGAFDLTVQRGASGIPFCIPQGETLEVR